MKKGILVLITAIVISACVISAASAGWFDGASDNTAQQNNTTKTPYVKAELKDSSFSYEPEDNSASSTDANGGTVSSSVGYPKLKFNGQVVIDLSNATDEELKLIKDHLKSYDLRLTLSEHVTNQSEDDVKTGKYTDNLDENSISLDDKTLTITFDDENTFFMSKAYKMTATQPGTSNINSFYISFYDSNGNETIGVGSSK